MELQRFAAPGRHQCGLAWDGTHLWHSDADTEMVYALDPKTGDVAERIPCPGVRTGLTYADGVLIQVVDQPKRLCYLNRNGVIGHRDLAPGGDRYCGIEADGTDVWLGLKSPGVVERRDLETLEARRSYEVDGDVAGLTRAPGVVVYASYVDRLVRSVDVADGRPVGEVRVTGSPTGLTWDGSLLWYCDYGTNEICAIEPRGLW